MDNHKATPEQWAKVDLWADAGGYATGSCLLELRARVEALEAANRHRVFTAEEVRSIVVPAQAEPPASGLVEQVAQALSTATPYKDARAAIRAVAAHLRREYPKREGYGSAWANLLDDLANR
jgi:hypothetical protein